jgi:hypothetical protein
VGLRAFLEGFWDERLDALRREAERKEHDMTNATAEALSVDRRVRSRAVG